MCLKSKTKKSVFTLQADKELLNARMKSFTGLRNFELSSEYFLTVLENLNNQWYASKTRIIAYFIEGIGDEEDHDKVAKFLNKKLRNKKNQQTYGELIFNIVYEINDNLQSLIIGMLLNFYYAREKHEIDFKTFYKLIYYIKNSYVYDLEALKIYRTKNEAIQSDDNRLESLNNYGFLKKSGIDGGNWDENEGGEIYTLNDFGKLIFDLLDNNDFDVFNDL